LTVFPLNSRSFPTREQSAQVTAVGDTRMIGLPMDIWPAIGLLVFFAA